jgi:hypothetical protein
VKHILKKGVNLLKQEMFEISKDDVLDILHDIREFEMTLSELSAKTKLLAIWNKIYTATLGSDLSGK